MEKAQKILLPILTLLLAAALIVMIVLYTLSNAKLTLLQAETEQADADEAEASAETERLRYADAESLYRRLGDDLSDAANALSKLNAAGSPAQVSLLLAEVWRSAGSAGTALEQLPTAQGDSGGMSQFLTRVGDYAHTLLVSTLNGRTIGDEDLKQLESLKARCIELSEAVMGEVEAGTLDTAPRTVDDFYSSTKDEADITDYPTLIYDGPFSESNETSKAAGLTGDTVDEAGAQAVLEDWFSGANVSADGKNEGGLPNYSFTVEWEGQTMDAAVTETGGAMLYFMGAASGDLNEAPSDEESQALHEAAAAFLKEHGYGEMHPSYAQYYAGGAVLNYAALQDGVILYSDLIKVYIDRETKTVYGMDASHYCRNHRLRELPTPVLGEAEARERVSVDLSIESCTLALIPKTNSTELLCWECKGTVGETFYIVYINALTGTEEEIFRVINSEEGDLVV